MPIRSACSIIFSGTSLKLWMIVGLCSEDVLQHIGQLRQVGDGFVDVHVLFEQQIVVSLAVSIGWSIPSGALTGANCG